MHKLVTLTLAALLAAALAACGASPAVPDGGGTPTSDAMAEPTTDAAVEPTTGAATQPTAAGSIGAITISDLQAAADNFYGQAVTVSGDVSQVYNELAFTVTDTSAASGPLLVISPSSVSLSPGQSVEISGTLQQLDAAQIQQDLGITLDQNVTDLAGQPVLIASQIDS